MKKIEALDKYILNYAQSSDKIRYNGSELSTGVVYDANSALVKDISLRLRETNYEASVELLKDLFIYYCEESAEIWACYEYLGEIGQALIEKSITEHVLDYLHYSMNYFDCLLASGQVKWEDELVVEIRDHLEKLQLTATDKKTISAINFGLDQRFGLHHINDPKIKEYLSKPIKKRLKS